MSYPDPVPGLVVRYNYLWDTEKSEGLSLGSKDRPCAIVVYHASTGDTIVVPITHSPPALGEEDLSIEVPPDLSRELGLDDQTNWIRVSEVNRFQWPGVHLRPLPSDPNRYHYGMIPKDLFERIKAKLHETMKKGRVPLAKR
ncbi:type II toxin-antitoxin system PemK/MazF family toxin [Rhizobium sp. SL86]|uniref:type II toxin-antitoxin system PemK/MazF family toxin n=1 Tax=Rhizobium sp. SL86 TaxID=2995148 RepID=UPI002273F93D|nr:type II toxin-antitoxin system PemK/MazF family toxin [Rhizobium sp. SL86]MCY1664172.1 type II toxin-antitoxin system PemK/MazF family toxin [Rhizobium sp. SL86]